MDAAASKPNPLSHRTASGGFKTSEGTLYVSKPFRSRSSKKLRALITFAPRKSHFDITNEATGSNEFRGFFSLFWISIFIFTIRTYVRSIETSGRPLNLNFATMFSQDAVTLAISDAILVLCTGLCVPFSMLVSKGWIKYYWTGVVLQHLFQTSVLFIAITWTFNRQWPWVQSGFLTLHSLVMIMKMHSYMTVNGHLQRVTEQSQSLLDHLRETTETFGGWQKALSDARAHRTELDAQMTNSSLSDNDTHESTPTKTPEIQPGAQSSYVDPHTATALRRRLAAMALGSDMISIETPARPQRIPTPPAENAGEPEPGPMPNGVHPLVDHPAEEISSLAKEYTELQGELTSTGPESITWPNNITFKNFAMYQLTPTLVYELEYPRTDKIRPGYLFEKTIATFGTFALLYTFTESFILPFIPTTDQSFFRSLLDLALPFMIAYLLLFFIIFECICNGFAELSYFADRQFYEDWVLCNMWNSTSWDEFSRKWNKPVYAFLLRHVYAPSILSYELSRTSAMFVTFLLSACVHELVMVVVSQKFRMYLFVLQIVQIPMIVISRIPIVKRNKLLGNIVFWLGLYAGFPLLCVAYVTY